METDPIRNENQGLNVDAARRRLLKLAAYSVPAILTVSFLPVEKVLARPNADSPKTPKTPQTPKSPQQPKPTSPPQATKTPKSTSTPKPTKTLTPQTPKTPTVTPTPVALQSSAPKAASSSAGGSDYPEALRSFLQFLRQLGFLR